MTASAKPEAEGESWPERNPESSSPEAEAGGSPEGDGSPEAEGWPEAGPEWDVAKATWAEAWPLHVYLFALAYLLISLVAAHVALAALLRLRGPRLTSMTKTTVSLSAMVCSFSLTRAVLLLADPYSSRGCLPFVAVRLLWSLGLPGFTASFSIMLLMLLDSTKLSLGPPRFQNVATVSLLWLLHVLVVLGSDLLVLYVRADVRVLLVLCQLLFVLYGILVALGYAYVGVRMRNNLKASNTGGHEGTVGDLFAFFFFFSCLVHFHLSPLN